MFELRIPLSHPSRLLVVASILTLLAACTDPPPENGNNGTNNGGTNNGGNNGGECSLGDRSCLDDKTLRTCTRDPNGGFRFVETECFDSEVCSNGDCIEEPKDCEDTCTPPQTRCTPDGQVETCADHDQNGCFEFGDSQDCDAGQFCDADSGLCADVTCTDQCTQGDTQCQDDLLSTCATNAQGCLDWGPAKECPEDETCQGGTCQTATSCDDECTDDVCTADGELRTCSDSDGDGCTDLSAATACPSNETCRSGACEPESNCSDKCLSGEKICVVNRIATCEDTDNDGCLEFNESDCPMGESCSNDGGTVQCEAPPATGPVVINEVYYDVIGNDSGAGPYASFIELKGPPGLSIAGYELELINGSGLTTYGLYTVPSGAQLDGNGFAVLAMKNPDTFLSNVVPFATNVYYVLDAYGNGTDGIQNGPDNVWLSDDQDNLIDALGYGDFSGGADFVGEGSSAPDVLDGRSLGRPPGSSDTDDNSADFLSYFPTPGIPNADLVINEVYVNQPGTDDGSETFVELMAPITGNWENRPLDGYVLRAINGFNDMDYITSGPIDGISMIGANLFDSSASEGYVVICNETDANASLKSKCAVQFDGVDFQNGPDSFVLEFTDVDGNKRVLDAISYGDFSSSTVFGEGTPVPYSSTDAGKSMSRWPITDPSVDYDTDDNATDFHVVDPSPGGTNPLPSNP